jgi:hypothetical protein
MLEACQPCRSSNRTVSHKEEIKITASFGQGGYFAFMINTINVANAIANDSDSYILISTTPFQ